MSEDAQKTILRCSICGYQTIRSTRFEKHQKIHLAPVDREMFTCAHCDKPYISKQGLKHHIEDNHIDSRKKKSQGKVYKCAICDYETLCRSNLERHNNVHLAPEERQMFACELCDKKCRSKKGLQYHLKNAHVDFRNADCIPTDEVILDSLKIEMDELTSLLDDTKNTEYVAKIEDFIKMEPDDDVLFLDKDTHF
ncbi:RE1-silencing transcription factor B-like isoform X2 [Sitophilus oryzae]|uniref:RE1-silencing transcription factor B-like isoform X2 n=1 Tax=Sitophilus oryzae TaxID=7048 RepID=A0A6J2XIK5_SITOR|nr:RE1-silencing transcription factor B-like isoform X2 [Sitophilus oryzae]